MSLDQAGQERDIAEVNSFRGWSVRCGQNVNDVAVGDGDCVIGQPAVDCLIGNARGSVETPP
ncbi:MAG: hypothetical protein F4Y95_05740 [Chloroflexi bacterium]|nr:hypothetical protein [Chloroflexota bacterium]